MEQQVESRGRRKVRQGKVISDRMQQTLVVEIKQLVQHPLYGKIMRRSNKIKVHDPEQAAGIGDTVEIMECRPISKEKHWRLVRVVEKAK